MTTILRDVALEIETPRLLMRCPRAGDGPLVFEATVETLDDLRAWPASLPWSLAPPTIQASEAFCRQGQVEYLSRTGFPLLLFDKASGLYVGGSGLHHVDWAVPSCEVGYWCRKRFQGQGLITEAVRAISEYALTAMGMRRIVSRPDAENRASCRVAERAGYVLEGIMKHERSTPDGTLRNTALYAITR